MKRMGRKEERESHHNINKNKISQFPHIHFVCWVGRKKLYESKRASLEKYHVSRNQRKKQEITFWIQLEQKHGFYRPTNVNQLPFCLLILVIALFCYSHKRSEKNFQSLFLY